MEIEIKGIGVVGGFGTGISELTKSLSERKICPERISISGKETVSMPVFLSDTSALERFISKKELRRIDHFTKMALLGAYLALEDAGMLNADRKRMGIIVATGFGAAKTTLDFLDSFEQGDEFSSPIKFSNSVHNAPAAHISIFLNENGPNLTVSQFEMSFPSALFTACLWLKERRVDSILIGGVDEYCGLLGYCWTRLNAQVKNTIGEGSVFFLLRRREGDAPGCAGIENVQMGNFRQSKMNIPKNALCFLNLDKYSIPAAYYSKQIGRNVPAACYTPLYGSLPVGLAYDIAIAALSIKEDKIFASPELTDCHPLIKLIDNNQSPCSEQICCVKLGFRGEYGVVTLRRAGI